MNQIYENFYSNIPNVNLMRVTYTVSINSADPSTLLYDMPNEIDFNDQFLTIANNKTVSDFMGFCFHKCYNYRQSSLMIPKAYFKRTVSF